MKLFGFTLFEPEKMFDQPVETSILETQPSNKQATDDSYKAYSPEALATNAFKGVAVARELVGIALNTQARQILGGFTFTQTGSIAVGKYVTGVSGDIRISPSGIVGRNSAGTTTFTIDGTTGDATFYGTVTATAGLIGGFTLTAGYMYAGSGTSTCGLSPVDYPFWAGATYANRATAPFRITPDGAGVIGGLTVTTTYLYAGTGANTAGLAPADYPFWAGATYANRATAPVRITPAGAITVTDITVNVSSETGGGSGADFKYSNASRVLINGSGVLARNTRGFFMEETTAGNYGSLTIGADNIMVLKAGATTDSIYFEDHDGNTFFKVFKQTVGGEEHSYVAVDSYLELLWRTNGEEPGAGKVTDGSLWYDESDHQIHAMINGARYKVDVTAL